MKHISCIKKIFRCFVIIAYTKYTIYTHSSTKNNFQSERCRKRIRRNWLEALKCKNRQSAGKLNNKDLYTCVGSYVIVPRGENLISYAKSICKWNNHRNSAQRTQRNVGSYIKYYSLTELFLTSNGFTWINRWKFIRKEIEFPKYVQFICWNIFFPNANGHELRVI